MVPVSFSALCGASARPFHEDASHALLHCDGKALTRADIRISSAEAASKLTEECQRRRTRTAHSERAINLPSSPASVGFTDYSQVDILALRYKFINFGAEKSPGSPKRVARIDWGRASGNLHLPLGCAKIETGNQKPETGNQKPETRNRKPETGNRKPDLKSGSENREPETGKRTCVPAFPAAMSRSASEREGRN